MVILKKLILALIVSYQRFISPLFPPTCRFYPSCSSYARDAFGRYHVFYASYLTFRRVIRCHPWHPGGYDPVP